MANKTDIDDEALAVDDEESDSDLKKPGSKPSGSRQVIIPGQPYPAGSNVPVFSIAANGYAPHTQGSRTVKEKSKVRIAVSDQNLYERLFLLTQGNPPWTIRHLLRQAGAIEFYIPDGFGKVVKEGKSVWVKLESSRQPEKSGVISEYLIYKSGEEAESSKETKAGEEGAKPAAGGRGGEAQMAARGFSAALDAAGAVMGGVIKPFIPSGILISQGRDKLKTALAGQNQKAVETAIAELKEARDINGLEEALKQTTNLKYKALLQKAHSDLSQASIEVLSEQSVPAEFLSPSVKSIQEDALDDSEAQTSGEISQEISAEGRAQGAVLGAASSAVSGTAEISSQVSGASSQGQAVEGTVAGEQSIKTSVATETSGGAEVSKTVGGTGKQEASISQTGSAGQSAGQIQAEGRADVKAEVKTELEQTAGGGGASVQGGKSASVKVSGEASTPQDRSLQGQTSQTAEVSASQGSRAEAKIQQETRVSAEGAASGGLSHAAEGKVSVQSQGQAEAGIQGGQAGAPTLPEAAEDKKAIKGAEETAQPQPSDIGSAGGLTDKAKSPAESETAGKQPAKEAEEKLEKKPGPVPLTGEKLPQAGRPAELEAQEKKKALEPEPKPEVPKEIAEQLGKFKERDKALAKGLPLPQRAGLPKETAGQLKQRSGLAQKSGTLGQVGKKDDELGAERQGKTEGRPPPGKKTSQAGAKEQAGAKPPAESGKPGQIKSSQESEDLGKKPEEKIPQPGQKPKTAEKPEPAKPEQEPLKAPQGQMPGRGLPAIGQKLGQTAASLKDIAKAAKLGGVLTRLLPILGWVLVILLGLLIVVFIVAAILYGGCNNPVGKQPEPVGYSLSYVGLAGYSNVCESFEQSSVGSYINERFGEPSSPSAPSAVCAPVLTGEATVEKLASTCFGAENAGRASGIAGAESGGRASLESGVDVCKDGSAFSVGLFQINLIAHGAKISQSCSPSKIFQINRKNPQETQGTCLKRTADNKVCLQYDCSVIDKQAYENCKAQLKQPSLNIQLACQISQNGKVWSAWGANGKCQY